MATTTGKRGVGAGTTGKASAALDEYARKRDFTATAEPGTTGRRRPQASGAALFVVQKHAARRLHYDFRLELDGSLKSWAVPKGPSLDPHVRRLAVHVEDHPLAYADFEGRIAEGQYGAGEVIVWDRGVWQPDDADPAAAYRAGKLKFHLLGDKLSGGWTLVRTGGRDAGKEHWLLIKERDDAARAVTDYDILAARPESVASHARLAADTPKQAEKAAMPRKAAKARESSAAAPEAALPGAKPAPLLAQLRPALATLVDAPPPGDWRYEIKFDGYRLLARIDDGSVQLFTRSGLDWTAKLPAIADALRALGPVSAWLDGEIVVVGADGLPDFQALQNAFEAGRTSTSDVVYFVFDLPYLAGLDLKAVPLEARRASLRRLIEESDAECLRYSEDFSPGRGDVLRSACALKLEGVIGKRAGSPYVSRRTSDWIKLKCKLRQEFVIGGYTDPQGSRTGFGALLLGVQDDSGALRYAGRVGTGFSETSLRALHARMQPLVRRSSPFGRLSGRDAVGVTWLEPRVVCEVEFAQWTEDGMVRQGVFRGLRDDKPGDSVAREQPVPSARVASSPARRGSRPEVAGVRISHPDRVIDAETGFTKLALAECYRDVAPQLLRHLAGRPVSLLRAPDGVAGSTFFQRHAETLRVAAIRHVDAGPGEERLMAIDNVEGLIGAVQMGAVEFHAWNADSAHLDQPDGMVFDLDPDPSLPWERVIEATRLVLTLLDELGLSSFLKTSGGKGMHILVPLARRHDWEEVKSFTKAVAQHLARVLPKLFVDTMGPKHRVGKIFVDYLRNQKGASTVAAYSVRARPGLPISMPIARNELDTIDGAAAWNVLNLAERLSALEHRGDPWAKITRVQRITRSMREQLGES